MKVLRKQQKKGKILIPWKLEPSDKDSVYVNIKGNVKPLTGNVRYLTHIHVITKFPLSGELPLDEDVLEGEIQVQLPQNPLPNEEDIFQFCLDEPRGYNAMIDGSRSCSITVNNCLGRA